MSETYNMPPLGLFGKRCRIKHVSNMKEGFVYRIVNDGIQSNVWKELPFGRIPNENVRHNYSEEILIVVCDTLIDDYSKLERVRLKDVEIMDEPQEEPFMNKPCVAHQICREDKNKVLDKIRAEIEQLPTAICTEIIRKNFYAKDFKEDVFKIIDKYQAESEDKCSE